MPAPGGICFLLRMAPRESLVFSQAANRSFSQKKHAPQEMLNGTTTRSPRRSAVTPAPASSTMPMNSWPRMSPSFIAGILPR